MAKGEISGDVAQFPIKPVDQPVEEDALKAGLSELTQLARQSFEDKRRKQCLTLTTAILKIDPENKEALVIQTWIREDLQKDLQDARGRMEEARRINDPALRDQVAWSVRGLLSVDPHNEEAKALLAEVTQPVEAEEVPQAQSLLPNVRPIEASMGDLPPDPPLPWYKGNRRGRAILIAAVLIATLSATFALSRFSNSSEASGAKLEKNSAAGQPAPSLDSVTGSLELIVIPQEGVQIVVDDTRPQPVPPNLELGEGWHRLVFTAEGYLPETVSITIVSKQRRVLPVILTQDPTTTASAKLRSLKPPQQPKSPTTSPYSRTPSAPTAAAANSAAKDDAPRVTAMGTLAVNAAIPVDVFVAGKQLGTTPLTVQLPQGVQTVEYRYQNLTKTVSYSISGNETTHATVVFDVTLQINARPWAQVSIQGSQDRTLGQTPLSNVTVPAGSVLVFKNPSFPEKTYRITGKDSAIQVVFP